MLRLSKNNVLPHISLVISTDWCCWGTHACKLQVPVSVESSSFAVPGMLHA